MGTPARGPDSFRIRYSGLDVQSVVAVSAMPGFALTLPPAGIIGPGTGMLRWDAEREELSFRAPGSTEFGVPVGLDEDSFFLIAGADRSTHLRIQRYDDFLPASTIDHPVYFREVYLNGMGDEVVAAEASAGAVETFGLTLSMPSVTGILNLKAWIDAAVDFIEISKDNVSFYAPDSEIHADVLSWPVVSGNSSMLLYVRRTIPAATAADPKVLNHLHFSFYGV